MATLEAEKDESNECVVCQKDVRQPGVSHWCCEECGLTTCEACLENDKGYVTCAICLQDPSSRVLRKNSIWLLNSGADWSSEKPTRVWLTDNELEKLKDLGSFDELPRHDYIKEASKGVETEFEKESREREAKKKCSCVCACDKEAETK